MSEKDDDIYQDAEPDGLGDLKKITRLSAMQLPAPQIRWGDEYREWPIERRLRYAERLASSMNHAADVLQQERNALLESTKRQEEQLKQVQAQYLAQGETMHRELGAQDAEKQQLYQQLVALQQQLRDMAKKTAFCPACGEKLR